eukprot:TRINITY_DN1459_c0_g1_i1.p1 TRINITY_DN1459_c0_g1~~TRINITY_DN1459_c0_g1_i1.p1  ORF type:complete len:208 (+),score=90.40 TRINITY_DN1459_c0_g1_i1:111-734(+)
MESDSIRLPPNVTIQKIELRGGGESSQRPPSEVSDVSSTSYTESESNGKDFCSDSSLLSSCEDSALLSKKVIPDISLTYQELVSIKTKDLNRILKDVPKERSLKIKSIRRTLKNRGYAASSRVKSLAEKEEVEKEIEEIKEATRKVNEEIDLHKYRLNVLKESCDQLLSNLDKYENAEELKAQIIAKKMALLAEESTPKKSRRLRTH